jgi:hypothetical protein
MSKERDFGFSIHAGVLYFLICMNHARNLKVCVSGSLSVYFTFENAELMSISFAEEGELRQLPE